MRYLEVTCRLLLAAVFVVAAFNKASGKTAWLSFVQSLHQLRQVPASLVRPVAVAAVTTETTVALLLLVPVRAVGAAGFAVAAGLLLAFTVVIGLAVSRGNRAPCRCFGASRVPLGMPHVIRNLVLILAAVLGLIGALSEGTAEVPYALLAGTGGLILGILITAAEDIVALVKPIGTLRSVSATSTRGPHRTSRSD
ncbi:MauE/DoxX family redox-associated membrane protein [Micromonospora soli]|uniref:MauE/DoxX family redox-associated membrane protein n=1 Tax=Micromonospora sp. NBRC 110009 TaxID=3061627 RepID=UPI0026727CDE|nr:MauE/DoxX family redox-associated membrane protein [Micromonospora sp. NBRC 110009]WKU01741.1 MauE/DoxX family redox-associated membrane protein [Micromonospora sp. NBRC 110009]